MQIGEYVQLQHLFCQWDWDVPSVQMYAMNFIYELDLSIVGVD